MAIYTDGKSEIDLKVAKTGDVVSGNIIWDIDTKGPVIRSADGTLWLIGVNDAGIFTSNEIEAPYGSGGDYGNLSDYI